MSTIALKKNIAVVSNRKKYFNYSYKNFFIYNTFPISYNNPLIILHNNYKVQHLLITTYNSLTSNLNIYIQNSQPTITLINNYIYTLRSI